MTDATTARLQDQLKATKRLLKVTEARTKLLPFLELMMPDPSDPDDADKTRYQITPQARLLCEVIEKVERGTLKRVAISIGPQMGKSQILSRAAPAWLEGRNPYRHMILGSYNSEFAREFGMEVRTIMQSPMYRQVFPGVELTSGGESKDMLVTREAGKMAFVGIGGSGSGKPADLFIVDDPYRGRQDADSVAYRESSWAWLQGVVMARAHDKTAIIVVHTRWHQDDFIGRLCDPDHPERNGLYKGLEKRWTYLNLPAVVTDPELATALGLTLEVPTDPNVVEQFGAGPMSALWPGRKSLPLMAEAREADKRNYESLYQGKPSPDEGTYFQVEGICEYSREDLPKRLRKYGASDHAVSKKQGRDYTCIGCIGIDESDEVWILPDVRWARMETDQTVEELLHQFRQHEPFAWYMESELISKSFGPFLRARMKSEKLYTMLDPITPSVDIETRARSIQGMMSLGVVHFPKWAPWYSRARQQILTFPSSSNDDFVAWLALVGLGVQKQLRPSKLKTQVPEPPSGSVGWLMNRAGYTDKSGKLKLAFPKKNTATAGW